MENSRYRHRAGRRHAFAGTRGVVSTAALLAAVVVTTTHVSTLAPLTTSARQAKEPRTYLSEDDAQTSAEPASPRVTSGARSTTTRIAARSRYTGTLDRTKPREPSTKLLVQKLSKTSTPTPTPTPTPTTPPTSDLPVLRNATFDSLPTGAVTPSGFQSQLGGTYNSAAPYEDTSVVSVPGRGNVLRTRLEAGTIVNNPSGTNGSTMVLALPKTVYTKACIGYDVRFDSGFDWSLGGKLPGLSGVAPGVSPSAPSGGNYVGDQGWSGRMMWLTPKSYSWAGPTNMGVDYMYHPYMTNKYGDNIRWNKSFVAGQWHDVRTCYTMNTVGVANGKLETWVDGVQVVANNAFVYRTRSDVGVGHLMWSVFRGGSTMDWAGSRTGYVDFDNVVITGS